MPRRGATCQISECPGGVQLANLASAQRKTKCKGWGLPVPLARRTAPLQDRGQKNCIFQKITKGSSDEPFRRVDECHHKVSCRRSLRPLRYNSICSRMSFFFNIPTNCPFCVTRRYRMPRARNISMTLSSGVFSVICPHETTQLSTYEAALGTST